MQRVLVIADPHYSTDSGLGDQKWDPNKKDLAQEFLDKWDIATQNGLRSALEAAKGYGPFDLVLSLGDNTPGHNERGIHTARAVEEYEKFRSVISEFFPEVPFKTALGNHELGYNYDTGAASRLLLRAFNWMPVPGAGINSSSLYICEDYVGPDFQVIPFGDWRILVVNTEIIRESKSGRHESSFQAELEGQVLRQYSRILDVIYRADPGKLILAGHDPKVLAKEVYPLFKHYGRKPALTLAGHVHFRTMGLWHQIWRPGLKLHVVPSTCRELGRLPRIKHKGFAGGFGLLEMGSEKIRYRTIYVR